MAFTFVPTLKDPDANSYVDLATITVDGINIVGAEDYFEGHPKSSKWESLTDLEKQQLLVKASSRINMETFSGQKTATTQRLEFPRAWLPDRNSIGGSHETTDSSLGSYHDSNYNPKELDQATCELALWYLEEWITEDPLVSRVDQERTSKYTIGALSVENRNVKEDALPDVVTRLLRAIGVDAWSGQGQLRVVR